MALASVPQPINPMTITVSPSAIQDGVSGGGKLSTAGVTASVPGTSKVTASASSRLTWKEWGISCGVTAALLLVAFLYAYYQLLPACQRSANGCGVGDTFRVSSDVSIFAGVFALALAVERFLAPLSRFIGPDTEAKKDDRDVAQAAAEADSDNAAKAVDLASKQAEVDKSRQIGSIVHWGVAVALSFVLAGKLNVLLLAAIADSNSARPAAWADLLVTGFVIGAGTKPLHDLVSGIEKSKETKQDPKVTGGAA